MSAETSSWMSRRLAGGDMTSCGRTAARVSLCADARGAGFFCVTTMALPGGGTGLGGACPPRLGKAGSFLCGLLG